MRPALLVLDPQNDFFETDNPNLAEFQATVPVINAASALFRQRQWPIVFVQHTSHRKPSGSYAWDIHAQFACERDDTRLSKTQYNALWNTELDSLLQDSGVDYVVVSGYTAEYCVLSTLRGAQERGYRAAVLEQAIASLDCRHTQFTLEVSPHISLADLIANAH